MGVSFIVTYTKTSASLKSLVIDFGVCCLLNRVGENSLP